MIVDDGESCHAATGMLPGMLPAALVSSRLSWSWFPAFIQSRPLNKFSLRCVFQSLSRVSHYSQFLVTFVNVSLLSVTCPYLCDFVVSSRAVVDLLSLFALWFVSLC
jgi:hypothetical protein